MSFQSFVYLLSLGYSLRTTLRIRDEQLACFVWNLEKPITRHAPAWNGTGKKLSDRTFLPAKRVQATKSNNTFPRTIPAKGTSAIRVVRHWHSNWIFPNSPEVLTISFLIFLRFPISFHFGSQLFEADIRKRQIVSSFV